MVFFNTLITRIVSLPIESYDSNKHDIIGFLKKNKLFELSILMASKSLFEDVQKNKNEKTKKPLENYFTRAHFNTVPFGLFNSVGLLKWGDETKIIKSSKKVLKFEYDNLFLLKKLSPIVEKDWETFYYCTNPSIHFIDEKKVGFYKSEKLFNENFETKYVEIDYDENLDWIIEKFKNGERIDIIIEELISDGFEKQEIHLFLKKVIEVGLILNETLFYPYRKPLEIPGLPSKLIGKGNIIINIDKEYESLKNDYLDDQIKLLVDDNVNYKYTHTTTSYDENKGKIDSKIQNKIQKFIDFTIVNNGNYTPANDSLSKFGNEFHHLHQDKFIPLTKVFNPYSGLKYNSNEEKEREFPKNIMSKILSQNKGEIHVQNNKANSCEKIDYTKLPATFNVVFELLNCKKSGKQIIYCKYLVGASALSLLARFDYVSNKLCSEIAFYEKKVHKNKILAEVNMFSSPRISNIVASHQYYDYSIPINTVYKKNSGSLFLSDLHLRHNGTRFILFSEKHNKEITPRITSAVNASLSDSDIYKFLADLQYQDNEMHDQIFNLNHYSNIYIPYVPRIFLEEDILLEPAQFLISYDGYNINEFNIYLLNCIKKYSFPNKVSFFDGARDIIIDINNQTHLQILFKNLKELKTIYLSEVLYESFFSEVKNEKSKNYAHEIVACIKNSEFQSVEDNSIFINEDETSAEYTPLVSDWLYFDVYSNLYAENEIFKLIYNTILSKFDSILFYYVRYGYPEKHLRIRFKTEDSALKNHIIKTISDLKEGGIIQKYTMLPYEPEVYRYGGYRMMELTEKVFHLDSIHTIEKLPVYKSKKNYIYYFSIIKIHTYLQYFNMSTEEMISFCEMNIQYFLKEFVLNAKTKKELVKIYNALKKELVDDSLHFFLEKVTIEKELEKSKLNKLDYMTDVIHMSINRVFDKDQRLNELKSYILSKKLFNQIKYSN
ncbi:thiopeptide-type bacteriocin biosynthesis protein [Maribacter sp.]|uniref:thiopeptide-type bacteriocin biosynthesis protein n=1 Tax=Maribacter sp. TaxID=1897614 RepID=UPI0025C5F36B|nr:thiopeptide-type bacteriocin biosynthesis protein [Maribacter sp.]